VAGQTKQPVVRGKTKPVLRPAQFNVVKALVNAGETGLTLDQLVHQSGHSDARGILRRLADSDPDWRSVIHFPGKGRSLPHRVNPHQSTPFPSEIGRNSHPGLPYDADMNSIRPAIEELERI